MIMITKTILKMHHSNTKSPTMKHLLLFFLFSGSLDGFSQVPDTTQPLRQFGTKGWSIKLPDSSIKVLTMADFYPKPKPDTLRCTLIVYYDNGPAILHTKPGFVVRGEREIYLDDRKRVIKAPWEVLTYKIKKWN